MSERRKPGQQVPMINGRRRDDPRSCDKPYSTEECGNWMGVSNDYIYEAITQGKWSRKLNCMVQLKAEFLPGPTATSRMIPKIYHDDFITFLDAIAWTRVPTRSAS